jgi:hypothetical protein
VDEKRLAELLKDAVADTPPPSFDHGDISKESARQRVRHRNGVLAGSAFGVALLAGATALGVALWTGPEMATDAAVAGSAASPSNGNAAPYELPEEDNRAAPSTASGGSDAEGFPPETPKQGGSPEGNGGPAGPAGTPSGCEQVDRELAAALAGELPAAANVKVADALPVSLSCPPGSAGARYDLPAGRITIIMTQPGVMLPTWRLRDGSVDAQSTASRGQSVAVVSEPFNPGDPAPFAADVEQIASDLGKLY